MIDKIAFFAGTLALSLAMPRLGVAQPVPPTHVGPTAGVPPYEIVTIVRAVGLEPLHRPVLLGQTYALRAVDVTGLEVRVIVDADTGRILRVAPLAGPQYGRPPFYGRPPGRIALAPDGSGPDSRVTVLPPGWDGSAGIGPGSAGPPAALGRPPGTSQPPSSAAAATPPPLPRPRPKVAAQATSGPPAEATTMPTSPVTPDVNTGKAMMRTPATPATEEAE